MDILQLKYFISVAETGHLTKAAKSLFIAQPALVRAQGPRDSALRVRKAVSCTCPAGCVRNQPGRDREE